jgi:hypothetical protein
MFWHPWGYFLLGYWTYRYRDTDLWLVLGVTAIVARMWVYHRSYDDMLVLLPMITLFRIAKNGPDKNGYDIMAGIVLALATMAMFVPALIFVFPAWKSMLKNSQSFVPVVMLIFLLYWSWRETKTRHDEYVFARSRFDF